MKKRFLAMLIAIAMLATISAPLGVMAGAPEVTVSYYDIDFETWTSWDGSTIVGSTQSDGKAITHAWGGDPYRISGTYDAARGGNVMKGTIPTSGGSSDGYLLRSRMRAANQPSNYNGTQILWNEFSIKYEDGFVGFGPNENTNAYNIISVNKDGKLEIGARWGYKEVGESGYVAGTKVPNGQLELGKWYDIKVAADFTDADAGSSGVPTYVWLNGELISSGIRISDIRPGYGWEYTKLWFDQAESTASTVYIDDIKVYETEDFGDLITPEDPEDPEEPEDPEIPVVVPDIDNSARKTVSYYDIDFESWTNWEGNNVFGGATQSNGDAITHEWGGDPYRISGTEDAERGGKVVKGTIPTSGGSSDGYLLRSRMRSANQPSNYNGTQVLWNEFSVKYENGFVGFGPNENTNAYSIISVNKDGQLEIGARWGYKEVGESGYVAGTKVPGGQLQLGQWYNIAVAADFTDADAGTSGVPTYVWVNGELISSGIRISDIRPGYGWDYTKFWLDESQNADTVISIDDVEIYETAEIGNGVVIKKEINVMTEALNSIEANISTRSEQYHPVRVMADGSKVDDSMYKSLKVAEELEGLKVVAALNAVYEISSVTVTERWMGDQGLTVTVEIGKNGSLTKVVDNQPVNKGSEGGTAVDTTYSFDATEGDTIVYTFKAATNRPEESDYQIFELAAKGSYVEDVAETGFVPEIGLWFHYADNKITRYSISCNYAGEEAVSAQFFIAAYDGDELVKFVTPVDVTLKKGANIFLSAEEDGIYDENYTYKAFIWKSLETPIPFATAGNIIIK